jgi:transposase
MKPLPNIEEFKQYHLSHSYRDTANHYMVSKSTIEKWRYKFDIIDKNIDQIKKYKKSKKIKLPKTNEFVALYNNFTNEEVSKYYGVSVGIIEKWRKELCVTRKSARWLDYVDYKLSDIQLDVIIGSLLGDGGLSSSTWWGAINSKFTETHSAKQRDYLKWKYDVLMPLSANFANRTNKGRMKLNNSIVDDHSKKLYSCNMTTISHPLFTELEKKWYARDINGNYLLKNGRRIKIIPHDITLTSRMISIWYFDDGSHNRLRGHGANFSTQAYTEDECNLLRDQLLKYGIYSTINRCAGKPSIYIMQKSYLDLITLVKQYLPCQCMSYKVDTSNYKTRNI